LKKINLLFLIAFSFILTSVISGCSTEPEVQPPDSTLVAMDNIDPCGDELLETTATPLTSLMEIFDDGADIAANSPHEQLAEPIANLQALRREAEDLEVPICLAKLKTAQIDYMNSVIDTLLMFLSLQDEDVVMVGVEISDELRAIYETQVSEIFGTEP
jgi:hypothetical protein